MLVSTRAKNSISIIKIQRKEFFAYNSSTKPLRRKGWKNLSMLIFPPDGPFIFFEGLQTRSAEGGEGIKHLYDALVHRAPSKPTTKSFSPETCS